MPTSTLADEILTPGEGQIRALVVIGGNPMTSWPDQEKTRRALEFLDLLVCIDVRETDTVAGRHLHESQQICSPIVQDFGTNRS